MCQQDPHFTLKPRDLQRLKWFRTAEEGRGFITSLMQEYHWGHLVPGHRKDMVTWVPSGTPSFPEELGLTEVLPPLKRQKSGTKAGKRPAGREGISPRVRFQIMRRDGFRCQLCGVTAMQDDVVLEIDHIHPVKDGGTSDEENLWTLCHCCNRGKAAKQLVTVAAVRVTCAAPSPPYH
jgi:hypothetical protein